MSFFSNNEVKAGLVAKLKADATLLAELSSSADIKEAQWQGTEFVYPAVRVRLFANDSPNNDCEYNIVNGSIMVFSEEYSSLEADRIAGIIRTILHKKSFSSSGVAFTGMRVTNLVPAIRQDENTWRSEVLFSTRTN